MAGQVDAAADKLRAYLRELKPGARALLIAELERGLLHGSGPAGAELVLAELRRSLREGTLQVASLRRSRAVVLPAIEPFLVDDVPDHKHRARIARSTLEPLWLWTPALMPEETQSLYRADRACAAGRRHRQAPNIWPRPSRMAWRRIRDAGRRRPQGAPPPAVQLGTARAFDDVQALRGILNARDGLAVLGKQLPGHIGSLAGPCSKA